MAGFMLLSCNTEVKEANYQIIPLPQEISVMDQAAPFILSNGTKIMYPEGNEKMQKNAEFLASYIKDLTGKSLAVQAGTDGKGIILQLGGNAENPEGYQLKVTSDQVVISGPTEAGVFYGIQDVYKRQVRNILTDWVRYFHPKTRKHSKNSLILKSVCCGIRSIRLKDILSPM